MIANKEFYLNLIRHGQSTTNQNPDLMGQEGNTPLSENGVKQAEKLGVRLAQLTSSGYGFTHVFSSPYIRALDTCRIATKDIYIPRPLVIADDIREYDAGDWTHASRKDTVTLEVRARMGALAHCFLPPNGESLHQVERRASKWLEDNVLYNTSLAKDAVDLADAGLEPPNILLFSHGMTIKCLLHYVMGFDQNFTWKVTINNTSISRLYFGKDGWRLLSVNDCAHLSTGDVT
jgi:probable phosphoglycerate mutase